MWNINQLKDALNKHADVDQWIVRSEHVHRLERYFLRAGAKVGIDQDRDSNTHVIQVQFTVPQKDEGRQGFISKKFFPSEDLNEQLENAVSFARETDQQKWKLPDEFEKSPPVVQTLDARMGEDLDGVMNQITGEINEAVSSIKTAEFNSAEVFLSNHDEETWMSNGLRHKQRRSRIYGEAAFAHDGKDGNPADEHLRTQYATNLDQFSIKNLFAETARRASFTRDVVEPASGKYSVIIDTKVLAQLFFECLSHFEGSSKYLGFPFIEVGSEFIPGAQGDLVSLDLNPRIDFGASSQVFSDQGVLQESLRLVDQNKVVGVAADQQYAQYLKMSPTTIRGNVVVAPGTHTYNEMTQADSKVLEILEFSALMGDPHQGTFSSEIRLGLLHDAKTGRVTPVKGGSLSGSIFENFKNAWLSSSQTNYSYFESRGPGSVFPMGYVGPDFALLRDVSVAGNVN